MAGVIDREGLPCAVIEEHLFEHRPREPYDAVVVLGVTEHLTDYPATLREFQRVLKPGGRVYLDATGSRRKWTMSTFARAHVWPGGGTRHAGEQLPPGGREKRLRPGRGPQRPPQLRPHHPPVGGEPRSEPDQVVERWGERTYRLFRLYLWGSSSALAKGTLEAYRMVLELPSPVPHRHEMWRPATLGRFRRRAGQLSPSARDH